MAWRLVAAVGAMLLFVTAYSCASTPITTSTTTEGQAATALLPAPVDSSKEALWGFIDTKGNWVIKPQFQNAYRFTEGLAPVEMNGKWGYVNQNGTIAIDPQFTEANYFEGGLARVATGPPPDKDLVYFRAASGYGFIDKSGVVVVKAQFRPTRYFNFDTYLSSYQGFHQGLAAVADAGGNVGYIDKTGKFVIQPLFVRGNAFRDGFAYVSAPPPGTASSVEETTLEPQPGSLRIIDLTGRVIYQAPEPSGGGSTSSS